MRFLIIVILNIMAGVALSGSDAKAGEWNAVKDNNHAPRIHDSSAPGKCFIWKDKIDVSANGNSAWAWVSGSIEECVEACRSWASNFYQIQLDYYKSNKIVTGLSDGQGTEYNQPYKMECRASSYRGAYCNPIGSGFKVNPTNPNYSTLTSIGGTVCIKN
ncbi:MAG: hypothetical protein R3B45_13795 [Bdellovibrionota bacterium]